VGRGSKKKTWNAKTLRKRETVNSELGSIAEGKGQNKKGSQKEKNCGKNQPVKTNKDRKKRRVGRGDQAQRSHFIARSFWGGGEWKGKNELTKIKTTTSPATSVKNTPTCCGNRNPSDNIARSNHKKKKEEQGNIFPDTVK